MAYNIQEQEDIETFKRFWQGGGAIVCAVLIFAIIGFLGWKFYQNSQKGDAVQATILLTDFSQKMDEKKVEEANKDLATLKSKYKNSPSTASASLAMALWNFENKKYPETKAELDWVLSNNKDELIVALATQRLALLYFQEKKYDEALAAIAKPVASEFAGVSLDIKGDILYEQGKKKEAAEAYEMALAKIPENTFGRAYIEMKRDQAKN